MGIDQNVGICLKTKESIRILKFEDKMGIDQNVEIWVLIVKIYQNVDIWVKSWKTIKKLMLISAIQRDQSKCWENLIDQNIEIAITQNVGIWLQNKELIRILKLRTKLGINQNVEIWVLTTKSFKMLYFEWKVGNQSKSWHLSAIRWELIKMLKF